MPYPFAKNYKCKRCETYFNTKAKITTHRKMHKIIAKLNKLNRQLKFGLKEK